MQRSGHRDVSDPDPERTRCVEEKAARGGLLSGRGGRV